MNWAFLLRPEFARLHRLMARAYQVALHEPSKRFDFNSMLLRPELYTAAAAMFRQAKGRNSPGRDGLVFDDLSDQALAGIVSNLVNTIATGAYTPDPLRWIPIKQGEKTRFVAKLTVREALLDRALLLLLMPVCEADQPANSYGFRPGLGAAHALHDVRFFLANTPGEVWFIRCDIKNFFAEIPHAQLLRMLRRRLHGGRLIRLLELRLRAWARVPGWGLAQGAPLSPLLASWYLTSLDEFFAARTTVLYCRFADDLLLAGNGDLTQARACQQELHFKLHKLGLRANQKKSQVSTAQEGVEYLGGRISVEDQRVEITVTEESLERLKNKLIQVTEQDADQEDQLKQLQAVTAGWVGAHRFDKEAGQRALDIVENTTGHRLVWNNRRSTTPRARRRTPLWMKSTTQRDRGEW